MKTLIIICALWGVALLPRVDCQASDPMGCPKSLASENPKKFDACMKICRGPGVTEVDPLDDYECMAELSGGSFVPGIEEFLYKSGASSTTSASSGSATSGSNSGSDEASSPTGGSDDDRSTSGGSNDTDEGSGDSLMGESQVPNEELKVKNSNKGPPVGAIAGGVVGGVVFLAIVGFLIFFLLRRKKQKEAAVHHEAVAVLDKSRTSSPTSHASPIYAGGAPPSAAPTRQTTYEDSLSQAPSQPQFAPSPAPAPAPVPPPPPPVIEPAELHSREVDPDGVSVSSFDMQRTEERSVPRLPVYHRDTPPGGSSAAL